MQANLEAIYCLSQLLNDPLLFQNDCHQFLSGQLFKIFWVKLRRHRWGHVVTLPEIQPLSGSRPESLRFDYGECSQNGKSFRQGMAEAFWEINRV